MESELPSLRSLKSFEVTVEEAQRFPDCDIKDMEEKRVFVEDTVNALVIRREDVVELVKTHIEHHKKHFEICDWKNATHCSECDATYRRVESLAGLLGVVEEDG